jgi:hypothetical protein
VVLTVAVLLLPGAARATPSVDTSSNVNLDGKLAIDIQGLQGVLGEIDTSVSQLMKSVQTQARDDIINVLLQTKAAVSQQLAQIQSASVAAINLAASRLDAQLQAVLTQARALASQAAALAMQVMNQTKQIAESIENAISGQLKQIQANVLEGLKILKSYVDEQLDRLYARSENTAANAAFQSRAFVDNAFIVLVRCALSGLLLFLIWRIVRDTRQALRQPSGVPFEPIVAGVVACAVVVLLASRPLLCGVLGVKTGSIPPDPCANALTDYAAFFRDKDAVADKNAVRAEGANLEEELQRCAYISVSADRVEAADELMGAVRKGLADLPGSTGAALAKK